MFQDDGKDQVFFVGEVAVQHACERGEAVVERACRCARECLIILKREPSVKI